MNLLHIFAIVGLAFLIKESDGPWGIMAWIRSRLMRNKYMGVFFYKLLDCYFCVGCHTGWIIYLLATPYKDLSLQNFVMFSLAGGIISLLFDAIYGRLNNGQHIN